VKNTKSIIRDIIQTVGFNGADIYSLNDVY